VEAKQRAEQEQQWLPALQKSAAQMERFVGECDALQGLLLDWYVFFCIALVWVLMQECERWEQPAQHVAPWLQVRV
jgi:hypothetical protein